MPLKIDPRLPAAITNVIGNSFLFWNQQLTRLGPPTLHAATTENPKRKYIAIVNAELDGPNAKTAKPIMAAISPINNPHR